MTRSLANLAALVPDIVDAAAGGDASKPLQFLCSEAVGILHLAAVDVVVPRPNEAAPDTTRMRVVAAAGQPEALDRITEEQIDTGEGPCIDAYSQRVDVVEPDLSEHGRERWPSFSESALDAGVAAAYSYHLAGAGRRLGVLNAFAHDPAQLDDEEQAIARVLAGFAGVCLVYRDRLADADLLTAHLQSALANRSSIELAVRSIARDREIDLDEAAVVLSRQAHEQGIAEHTLARELVLRDEAGADDEASDTAVGPIDVLLLDPQASFRELLGRALLHESDLAVVAETSTPDDALEAVAEHRPSVAVVTLSADTLDVVASLVDGDGGPRVLVLTAGTDEVLWGQAVERGAAAALSKDAELTTVLDAIRALGRGDDVHPTADVIRWLRAAAHRRRREHYARALQRHVTSRELEVLVALSSHDDVDLIAAQLGIAPSTVRTHIRNLMGKFDAGSRLQLVIDALRHGLVDPPADEPPAGTTR